MAQTDNGRPVLRFSNFIQTNNQIQLQGFCSQDHCIKFMFFFYVFHLNHRNISFLFLRTITAGERAARSSFNGPKVSTEEKDFLELKFYISLLCLSSSQSPRINLFLRAQIFLSMKTII